MTIGSSKPNPIDLARVIDHTLLRANATENDILQLCGDANDWNFYAVCVNPRWVNFISKILSTSLPITVVGFPLGASTVFTKEKECEDALREGAKEIDMVIDLNNVHQKNWRAVEDEVKAIQKCCGRIPLKVIIETAYLNNTEITEVSKCCLFGGATFVKTSTGFASHGATEENIRTIRTAVGPHMGIKASGGIKTWADAQKMLAAGATRLGCSTSVAIIRESNQERIQS